MALCGQTRRASRRLGEVALRRLTSLTPTGAEPTRLCTVVHLQEAATIVTRVARALPAAPSLPFTTPPAFRVTGKRAFTPNRPRLLYTAAQISQASVRHCCALHVLHSPSKLLRIPPSARPASVRTHAPQRLPFALLENPSSSARIFSAGPRRVQARFVPPAGVLLFLASLCSRHEGGATTPD